MDKPERLNNIRQGNILKSSLFGILLTKDKNIKQSRLNIKIFGCPLNYNGDT